MEIKQINVNPKVCIFCYKSIQSEYHSDDQNKVNVNKFYECLAKLSNFQRSKRKQTVSNLSSRVFGSCKDCEMITTQVCDAYHEMKRLELIFFWKLETLGKVMELADKVPSRVAFVKQNFENVETNENDLNNGTFFTQIEAFRNFRTKIKKQCNEERKLSMQLPRVLLRRFDETAQKSKRQVSSLQKALEENLSSSTIKECSMSVLVVLYLLSLTSNSSKENCENVNSPNILLRMDISSDIGADELLFRSKTLTSRVENVDEYCISENRTDELLLNTDAINKTSTLRIEITPTDVLSNDNIPILETDGDTEKLSNHRNQLFASEHQQKFEVKRENFDDENSNVDESYFQEANSDSCRSSTVSNNIQENMEEKPQNFHIPDRILEFEELKTSSDLNHESSNEQGNANDKNESTNIQYNFRKRNIGNLKTLENFSSSSSSESEADEDFELESSTLDSNVKSCTCEMENCVRKFSRIKDLKIHQKNDKHDSNSFTCQQCGKCFNERKYLKTHEKLHKKPEDWEYECVHCKKKCANKHNLTRHLVSHIEGTPWKCDICNKGFKIKAFLLKHSEYHKNQEDWKYQCSICKKKCINNYEYKRHVNTHSKLKRLRSKTGKSGESQDILKLLKCDICEKRFSDKYLLKKHSEYHKSKEEWKYQCSTCGMKCATSKDLSDHLQVHSDERPWICEQCGKKFKLRKHLKSHLKLHSNQDK